MGFNLAFKGLMVYTLFTVYTILCMDQDSSVGVATRCELDSPGIESRWEAGFSTPFHTGPEAHPASYTVGSGSFPEVMQRGVALITHPQSSAEVK
jgi:hypothetical protein